MVYQVDEKCKRKGNIFMYQLHKYNNVTETSISSFFFHFDAQAFNAVILCCSRFSFQYMVCWDRLFDKLWGKYVYNVVYDSVNPLDTVFGVTFSNNLLLKNMMQNFTNITRPIWYYLNSLALFLYVFQIKRISVFIFRPSSPVIASIF